LPQCLIFEPRPIATRGAKARRDAWPRRRMEALAEDEERSINIVPILWSASVLCKKLKAFFW
jgi:hypothetical protein